MPSQGLGWCHKNMPACSHVACDLLCLHEKVRAMSIVGACVSLWWANLSVSLCVCMCATRLFPRYPFIVLRRHWDSYLDKVLENRRCVAVCSAATLLSDHCHLQKMIRSRPCKAFNKWTRKHKHDIWIQLIPGLRRPSMLCKSVHSTPESNFHGMYSWDATSLPLRHLSALATSGPNAIAETLKEMILLNTWYWSS